MILILLHDAAEFPKSFCCLTHKVSDLMLRGAIWIYCSLQRTSLAFNSSIFKDFIL